MDAGSSTGGFRSGLERSVLAFLSTLLSINLWTGGPLLALWVGSQIQASSGQLTMGAVGATLGVLIAVTVVLYRLLVILNRRYDHLIGRDQTRRQTAWLRPMTAERRALQVSRPMTAIEKVVVISAVLAFEGLLVWFFFFAHCTFYCGG
jgi:hypothetical protein